jgi:hypothetical protein
MTVTIEINATYYTGATARVTFKDGKTWKDVKDWYIKWDTLNVLFNDETDWDAYPLESSSDPDATDWKRPISVSIHPYLDSGDVDYDTDYAGESK